MNTEHIWLDILLALQRLPVGMRFLYDKPEYTACQYAETSGPKPYCVAVRDATKGAALKMHASHFSCVAGGRALGVIKPHNDCVPANTVISGKRFAGMNIYEDFCVGRQVAKDMVYCEHEVYGTALAPLAHYTDAAPDVIIIIANPRNAMRLIQAHAYHSGQIKNFKLVGNQAICQECTSYPFERNCLNISMLCAGTRRLARWSDDEMGLGFPRNLLPEIIKGLRATSNAMDNNTQKKRIQAKLREHGLEGEHEVKLNNNYYSGAFGTVTTQKKRQLRKQTAQKKGEIS